MWNKIGEWLDYPEDWCELFSELLMQILIIVLLICYMLIPLFVSQCEGDAVEKIIVLVFWFGGWWMVHHMLDVATKWYPKLLSKLPSCPKINWNKGE